MPQVIFTHCWGYIRNVSKKTYTYLLFIKCIWVKAHFGCVQIFCKSCKCKIHRNSAVKTCTNVQCDFKNVQRAPTSNELFGDHVNSAGLFYIYFVLDLIHHFTNIHLIKNKLIKTNLPLNSV